MFQIVAALILAIGVITSGSLLWPRLTPQPRPPILTNVRNAVVSTPVGANVAQVLGVSDESQAKPITPSSIAADAAKSISVGLFNSLPADQKQQLQQVVCGSNPSTQDKQDRNGSTPQ